MDEGSWKHLKMRLHAELPCVEAPLRRLRGTESFRGQLLGNTIHAKLLFQPCSELNFLLGRRSENREGLLVLRVTSVKNWCIVNIISTDLSKVKARYTHRQHVLLA